VKTLNTTLSLGIVAPYTNGVITSGPRFAEFVRIAEECGVESLWTVEHVIEADVYEKLYPYSESGLMPGRLVPMADPLELLAFAAAVSSTLKLGTAVVVAPLHSAVVLAKRAATLHGLSGGRLQLGLGIGWQKEEYSSVGVPYADRGARLEETIGAMRALWAEHPASYHGRFIHFERIHSVPPPPDNTVPVLLGGNAEPAIRRCGRIGDGWYPHALTPEKFAAGAQLLRTCVAEAGRQAGSVPITVAPGSADHTKEFDRDWVRRFVEHGATRLVISSGVTRVIDLQGVRDRILRYREEIFDPLSEEFRG
jgi:probable F420-dependent oxidoreductase